MRDLIRLTIFMFVVNSVISCSTTPGYVTVQLKPEQAKVEYIRVYEKNKKHLARDLMPKGKGKYESVYTEETDVTVAVKVDNKKELIQDAHVEPGQYAYMEFDVATEETEVEFIRLKVNREFRFKPIHKGRKIKSIYISYIDYIGQNLGLTKALEKNLRTMGYKVLKNVDDKTELIATINLVDFSILEHTGGVNRQQVNKYKFKIGIEQRISGTTELQENYASARGFSDDMTYNAESYPLDDTENVIATATPTIPPQTSVAKEDSPDSPGLLVMLGLAEDEEKKEEADSSEEEAAQPAAPSAKEEKKEGEAEGKASETPAAEGGSGVEGFQKSSQVIAKSKLKYRPFKDEILVDASVRLVNLKSRDAAAVNQIVNLLSNRLAQIFNL